MKTFKQFSEELKSGLSTKTLNSYLDKNIDRNKDQESIDKRRKRIVGANKALDILSTRIK